MKASNFINEQVEKTNEKDEPSAGLGVCQSLFFPTDQPQEKCADSQVEPGKPGGQIVLFIHIKQLQGVPSNLHELKVDDIEDGMHAQQHSSRDTQKADETGAVEPDFKHDLQGGVVLGVIGNIGTNVWLSIFAAWQPFR